MFSSLLIFILMLALVSARPSPDLSLEDIEKELKELGGMKSDASEKKSDDKAAEKSDLSKELSDLAREVPKVKLDSAEKSVAKTEQKKDETTEKTKSDLNKKSAASDPVARDPLPKKSLTKPDFKDTDAYRRLVDFYRRPVQQHRTLNYDYPAVRKPGYTYRKSNDQPPFVDYYGDNHRRVPQYSDHSDILTRLYSGYQRDRNGIREGFLPSPDVNYEVLRRENSGTSKFEHVPGYSTGNWVQESKAVKVPDIVPLPVKADTEVRSYHDLQMQSNGLTDVEKRKRYLMDLLAQRLKSRVDEAHKRGLKVPDNIMDFLWNYESRRGMSVKADKSLYSH
ncbi:uncharacterized protein [Montipora capricornis]|uniref:uncharacterized protein isoform X1 n=1 Tax=Montipora capricornis TaxID=246305 RepID=UPI0035F12B20